MDDIETEEPRQELATVPQDNGQAAPTHGMTAQEHRTTQIAAVLEPAYQRASTLQLTKEESDALTAPFPPSAVEIRGFDGLIYLPHIEISNRLNRVLGIGQWALIRRREWYDDATHTMYGDYCLLVRGVFVGESVGGHPYNPTNAKMNYSDSLESTRAEALRRIAGKCLSCGDQVWVPEYSRQWIEKYAVRDNGKWKKRPMPSTQAAPAQEKPAAPAAPPLQDDPVFQSLKREADKGTTALSAAWAALSKEQRKAFAAEKDYLKEVAKERDNDLP